VDVGACIWLGELKISQHFQKTDYKKQLNAQEKQK
jgi:hypothetical protein